MDLSFLTWNCQGAASPKFQRVLKSILQGYKPDVLVLVEPRTAGNRADTIIRKIGYPNSHRIEAQGFSGGIWLLWQDSAAIEILSNHRQFIHTSVTCLTSRRCCLFTAVYGSPNPSQREFLWSGLSQLPCLASDPWLLSGDFNAIVSSEDRMGGARHRNSGCRSFRQVLQQKGLIDLNFVGPRFTWQRGNLMFRLDRAICNPAWLESYPTTQVMHLPRIQSDHRPLLIQVDKERPQHESHFKFLAP